VTVVYGIVSAETPLDEGPTGIGGAPVGRVVSGGLAALVSPVEGDDLRATRRDLLSHSAVLEHAVAAGPVLPLRFGIVLRDEEAVAEELLEARHDELRTLLKRFERLVELRVKAFYVEEAVLRELVRSDPAIARLNEATRGLPEASLHPGRIRLGEAVARALEVRRENDTRAILARLRPLAEEVVVEESGASRAFTASFLVERDGVEAFDRAMDELARAHEGLITFKYLGPLAPHSFVSFREDV
jgi:Gas vesicle synthesis protein GvpL/GvpF